MKYKSLFLIIAVALGAAVVPVYGESSGSALENESIVTAGKKAKIRDGFLKHAPFLM